MHPKTEQRHMVDIIRCLFKQPRTLQRGREVTDRSFVDRRLRVAFL